jgi:hypothetical protein
LNMGKYLTAKLFYDKYYLCWLMKMIKEIIFYIKLWLT